MPPIRAVLFDYYETLVDVSTPNRIRHFDNVANDAGLVLEPGEAYENWRNFTSADTGLRMGGREVPLDGDPPPFRTFGEIWRIRTAELYKAWGVAVPEGGEDLYNRFHIDAVAYPEVPAALRLLRQRFDLGVLSNADDDFLLANMRRNNLQFRTVVSSEGAKAYKPHISIFEAACAEHGVAPEEAAYVGDSPWADVAGAQHAGLRAVWINRHGATWPDDQPPPDDEIASLAELPELL